MKFLKIVLSSIFQEVYKQRQQAFKKVEEEIEAQLAKEEEEEQQQRENDNLRKQLDDNHTGNTSGKVSGTFFLNVFEKKRKRKQNLFELI